MWILLLLLLTTLCFQQQVNANEYPPNIYNILHRANPEYKALVLELVQAESNKMMEYVSRNINNDELLLIAVHLLENRNGLVNLFDFMYANGPNYGRVIITKLPVHIRRLFTQYILNKHQPSSSAPSIPTAHRRSMRRTFSNSDSNEGSSSGYNADDELSFGPVSSFRSFNSLESDAERKGFGRKRSRDDDEVSSRIGKRPLRLV